MDVEVSGTVQGEKSSNDPFINGISICSILINIVSRIMSRIILSSSYINKIRVMLVDNFPHEFITFLFILILFEHLSLPFKSRLLSLVQRYLKFSSIFYFLKMIIFNQISKNFYRIDDERLKNEWCFALIPILTGVINHTVFFFLLCIM